MGMCSSRLDPCFPWISSWLHPCEDLPIPASTSLPSSSAPNLKWDVFLSFRGEDTRYNFVDHLYINLKQKGINAFLDEKRLEQGKEIYPELLKAIEESRFAIIIFSENYASSSWCLDELVHIIDCTKVTGLIPYPVFYKVDPSNVRNQKGSFAKAFDEHKKKNLASGKVKIWREALRRAGNLSGWDTRDRSEATIIQKIVEMIFDKLTPALPQSVDDNLVGMEIHLEGINTLLNTGSEEVKFVGILGLGGIGKSTIAKYVYNQIHRQFDGCSYLANIRKRYEKEQCLVPLQKQLLSDILNLKKLEINDDGHGSSIINSRLKNLKVLVILDDVDLVEQLEKLIGNGNWFGLGSRIIVTTRERDLLNTYGWVERYEVRECDRDKSFEIFSWKAFKQNYPPDDYMDLSTMVVNYTKGLPLALTVLGSHLCCKSQYEWKCAIDQLTTIPNTKINDILKISYEGLEERPKEVFLDIACFFIGEDIDDVKEKLDSFGFSPGYNVPVLINKSLITVSAKNELMMHDLVRDMGRDIVIQKFRDNPEKRSRLWKEEDIYQVLRKNKGTEEIEGIQLTIPWKHNSSLNPEVFTKMENLRYLFISSERPPLVDTSSMHFPEGISNFPDKLKILKWPGYPCEHLPFDFTHDKIVHLSLFRSEIKLLWNGRKDLEHLKSIDLSYSNRLRVVPDVSGLPNLERLSLCECKELVEIDPSVWVHKGLKFLDLRRCYNLGSFPNKIEMESLETLYLHSCKIMKEFPEVHVNMKCLSELVLSETAIKELPSSIENFTALKILNLGNCEDLVCLPSSICKLNLEKLFLTGCSNLKNIPKKLPECIVTY